MKYPLSICVAGILVLTGCGNKEEKPESKSGSGNPLTAPVDYLGAVHQAQKSAVRTVDIVGLQQGIQMFQAQEGRNPRDLNELVAKQYLPRIPTAPAGMRYVYNPASGEVRAVRE
jgi:hypothetical protein